MVLAGEEAAAGRSIEAGVAGVDITPPAGLAMAGFGARSEPATGRA